MQTDDLLGAILVKQLKLETQPALDPEALLSDLGLDSLGMLAFIASLEREFDVSISDLDYEGLVTFGDAVALLHRLRHG